MTVISVKQLLGETLQFGAGASLGQEHFGQIIELIRADQAANPDGLVVFDYAGVDDVSASYVKATLLATHRCGRLAAGGLSAYEALAARPTIAPLSIVVAVQAANDDVKDCISDVFAANGVAIMASDTVAEGLPQGGEVLGAIEPTAFRTLQLAARFNEVTAALLHSTQADEQIAITGWNNRLADLHRQLLLRRQTSGRQHTYRPLVKGDIRYGKILSRK